MDSLLEGAEAEVADVRAKLELERSAIIALAEKEAMGMIREAQDEVEATREAMLKEQQGWEHAWVAAKRMPQVSDVGLVLWHT